MTKVKYNRKAIYIGKRLSGDRAYHAFLLLPEKKEMYFAKTKGALIGYTYECTEEQMAVRPERTDDERVDDPSWEAEQALVEAHYAKRRAENAARASSSPHITKAIAALAPLMVGKDYFARRALIEFLVEKTQKAKKKAKK